MGVTYVWWSYDMDEKCYVGAYVYGEYRECGGLNGCGVGMDEKGYGEYSG